MRLLHTGLAFTLAATSLYACGDTSVDPGTSTGTTTGAVTGTTTGTTTGSTTGTTTGSTTGTTTGTTTPVDGTLSGGGTTCTKMGELPGVRWANGQPVGYRVLNNAWKWTDNVQCVQSIGNTFVVTAQGGVGPGNEPYSYPSVLVGVKDNYTSSFGSGLPKPISQITSVMTHWTHNAGTIAGSYNATYDVWFNRTATDHQTTPGDKLPTAAYLMVWEYDPAGRQPIGSRVVTGIVIDGVRWDIWHGPGPSGAPCTSYTYPEGQVLNGATLEIKDFINDAVSRGYVPSNSYLAAVFAGFEIWSGGAGLATTDYWVALQ